MSKASEWKKSLYADVLCPSGATVKQRRVPREALLTCGRLPQPLMEKVIESYKIVDEASESQSEAERDHAAKQQLLKSPDVVDAMIIASVDCDPRVVWSGAREELNEINIRDIPDEDRIHLFHNAEAAMPDLPVQTESGEVPLSSIDSFRPERPVSVLVSDGTEPEGADQQVVGAAG